MNVFVGAAALAGTAIGSALPIDRAAAAPKNLALDGAKISSDLRDLGRALQDADDALMAAQAAFDADYLLYAEREKRHLERFGSRRPMRKWDRLQERYMEESNFLAAQDAQVQAGKAHKAARQAICEYRARDLNELIHMACHCVFEDGSPHRRYNSILSVGVAFDLARMGTRAEGLIA